MSACILSLLYNLRIIWKFFDLLIDDVINMKCKDKQLKKNENDKTEQYKKQKQILEKKWKQWSFKMMRWDNL